jgi:alpha-methylacyl-CoA racemase
VAAAPLEDKFWNNFCRIIELPQAMRLPDALPDVVIARVAALIASKTADEWRRAFAGQDVCRSIVMQMEEAIGDPHTAARRVFDQQLFADGRVLPALPVPISPELRSHASGAKAPHLGEHRADLESAE